MLICAREGSPHHYSTRFYGRVKVLLNGHYEPHVVEADDEAGYLIRTKRDAEGRIVSIGRDIQFERLEGVVTFDGHRRGDV